jgi:hypothetical protein
MLDIRLKAHDVRVGGFSDESPSDHADEDVSAKHIGGDRWGSTSELSVVGRGLFGHISNASAPMLYKVMLDEGKSDAHVFATVFLAKLPVFAHQAVLGNPLKGSLIPYSSFAGILLLHWGSLTAYDHRLDSNPYMVRVTATVNAIAARFFPCSCFVPDGEGGLQGVSSATLTVVLWIILQSAAFWVLYHQHKKWEGQLRAKFIASRNLPKDTPLVDAKPDRWDLVKAHVFFLWLITNGFDVHQAWLTEGRCASPIGYGTCGALHGAG